MAVNENVVLKTPVELTSTAVAASDIVIIAGSGAPSGASEPQASASKGSLYLRDAQTDDLSALYLKIDADTADDDWRAVLIDNGADDITYRGDVTLYTDKAARFRSAAMKIYSSAATVLAAYVASGYTLRLGNAATNYTEFDHEGTQTLVGNARVTKRLVFMPPFFDGTSAPTATQTGDYPGEAFTIGDSVLVSFQVPDDADLSADIGVHLRWYANEDYATANGEIQWAVAYSAAPYDETEAVDGAGYTGDLDAGDQNIPATAKFLTTTDCGDLAGASLAADDIVALEISRVALDDGIDPTAEPVLVSIAIEYTSNRLGA